MSTDFPGALDTTTTLPNPSASSATNSPSHAGLHANVQDSVKAIEAKVGTGSSTATNNTFLIGTGSGTSSWSAITSAQLAARISDETGSGSAVFATTPTLVTPKIDTINENTPANGTTIGGVNIKSGALNTNNSVVSSNITALAVTSAKINTDAVTATKIDWASTGADAGIWWEEVSRTTLAGAGDVLTASAIPARKYLNALLYLTSTGGNLTGSITFNGDTGANYARRFSNDGAADTTGTGAANIGMVNAMTGTMLIELLIVNVAATEKIFRFTVHNSLTAGAANIPERLEGTGKWANTANAISSITLTNTGTGDYAIGSEIVVLGHN